MIYQQTLAQRIAAGIASGSDVIPARAHTSISRGMVIKIDLATGNTLAPVNNDRLGLFGVALENVSSGTEGSFKIDGFATVLSGSAIAYGQLIDCSADMKVNALGVQTNGNGFARAVRAATGADQLVLAKIL